MTSRLAAILTVTLMILALATGANATSWTSFIPATFSDIYVNPAFTSGVTTYELSMGPNPTITFGSNTYAVNWIQGFYAAGEEKTTTFVAADGDAPAGWTWVSKTNPGEIAGWSTTGQNRLQPNGSGLFHFSALTFPDNALVAGFHLAYQDGNNQVTNFFKGSTRQPPVTNNAVPELSTPLLATTGMMLTGMAAFRRKRGTLISARSAR